MADTTNNPLLLRLKDCVRLTSCSASTLRRLAKKGQFIQSIALAPNVRVYETQALIDWIQHRRAETDAVRCVK